MAAKDVPVAVRLSLADKVLIQHALGEYLRELKDKEVTLDSPEDVRELLERLKRNG